MTGNAEYKPQQSDIMGDTIFNSPEIINVNTSHPQGFCYYLGILLFAPYFSMIKKKGCNFIIQWVIAILLGAKNIEQTKTLNYSSLNIILGETIKSTKNQRKRIKESATQYNIDKLLAFNIELVGIGDCSDFYYDPHTKNYTGLRNILKGWCSKVKGPAKVINSDYIHTRQGYPVYIDIDDVYDDVRIRFFRQVAEFRRLGLIGKEKEITFFIDRAIFSEEVFDKVLQDNSLHLVTWEKDYGHDQWDEGASTKKEYFKRVRNNSNDFKIIPYQYQEKKWDKNDKIRQIIIRIEHPENNDILEVSILCDDYGRSAIEIILTMFDRWLQENDFKYLINHFGIDQITTYDYIEYKDLKDKLNDKKHINGKYKAITKEIKNLRNKIKTVLYKIHRLDRKQQNKKLTKNEGQRKLELEQTKYTLNIQIEKKEQCRKEIEKDVSKIDELIEKEKQKMQTQTKLFMDVIKIISRNIFYKTSQSFRTRYNNYRDDLLILREVTKANGIIKKQQNKLIISLLPEMELTPKMKRSINETINEINQKKIEMPNKTEF